jgi:hypothetical protein
MRKKTETEEELTSRFDYHPSISIPSKRRPSIMYSLNFSGGMTCAEDQLEEGKFPVSKCIILSTKIISIDCEEEKKKGNVSSTTVETAKESTPRFEITDVKCIKESSQCKYSTIKEKLNLKDCIRSALSNKEYMLDYECVTKPKLAYTVEPLKEKIKSFTPEILQSYSKNTMKYASK